VVDRQQPVAVIRVRGADKEHNDESDDTGNACHCVEVAGPMPLNAYR